MVVTSIPSNDSTLGLPRVELPSTATSATVDICSMLHPALLLSGTGVNTLKTEIESLKRISRVFERNGAFFSRIVNEFASPGAHVATDSEEVAPYESAPATSRSQVWLFAPAQNW